MAFAVSLDKGKGNMKMEGWSFKPRDLIAVPNLITYCRFILVVPFVYFFLQENYIVAGIMIGLSGLSDCFDGLLARKLNQVTSLGKLLDPIADKVTLIAVAVCMLMYMPAILPIMLVLVAKEFLMLLGGFILLLKKITPPPANIFGKVATVVFYFTICLIIFLKAAFQIEITELIVAATIFVAVVMLVALAQYAVTYFRLTSGKRKN